MSLLPDLSQLDLSAPYCRHWRELIEHSTPQLAQAQPIYELLNQLKPEGFPKRFVPQENLPVAQAYESFIYESGGIPTREGPHDYFNGLCWLLFTQSKVQLNRLQAAEIKRDGVHSQRGPVRDAITIFDENGLVLACSDELWDALCEKDWQRAFIDYRAQWDDCRIVIFGHALMEKLLKPYKGICAHVIRIPHLEDKASLEEIDLWLSQTLDADFLRSKPFIPLPIFGIPGWHPEQGEADFYRDEQVFRPPRR